MISFYLFVIFYGSVTTQTVALQMFSRIGWIRLESHKYWQDSNTIYQNVLGNTAQKLGMNYKSVKNTPKALRILCK